MMALLAAACAQQGQTMAPAATNTASVAPPTMSKRQRPVVAGRPARLYIFAGFDEGTCKPVEPKLSVSSPPLKGTIEFRPGQTTTVMQSQSGKCIGQRMTGTGVYYTATKGQNGPDQFSVTARTPSGKATTKTFNFEITD